MRAAEAAPERATPQLLARALEYRLRGAGAPDEARRTIEELGCIRESSRADDAALRAFLLAEALDVVQGRGAGLRELEATRAVRSATTRLLGLGLAERFAAMGQASAAVDEYRLALRGSLLDLRKGGSVALHAAEAAHARRPRPGRGAFPRSRADRPGLAGAGAGHRARAFSSASLRRRTMRPSPWTPVPT